MIDIPNPLPSPIAATRELDARAAARAERERIMRGVAAMNFVITSVAHRGGCLLTEGDYAEFETIMQAGEKISAREFELWGGDFVRPQRLSPWVKALGACNDAP